MRTDDYLLPRNPVEYDRLRRQARSWEPATERLLDRIGLGPGARCLDAGCGPGETMRLMAERVGPHGTVTGIDADATIGAQALRALHAAGHRQCRFEPADVELDEHVPGGPFDLVFARLLLLHVEDPVAVLRRLWSWVAPGGHLVVQDHDVTTGLVVPPLEAAEELKRVVVGAFERAGHDLHLGVRLPALHEQAGIGSPDGTDVAGQLEPLAAAAPKWEAVYRSMVPSALALGVTTREHSEHWLAEFVREATAGGAHMSLWPLLIGTWKRRPD